VRVLFLTHSFPRFIGDAPGSFLHRLAVALRQIDVEVQVIALGDDVAWVSVQGEFFVELGMEIKRRSPFRQTIIVELANGTIGYIPTRRAFDDGN
jgi:hypothetical protein